MLEQQRGKSSFDVKELSYAIYRSQEGFEEFLNIQKKISNDPILRFDPSNIHISRKDSMTIYAKKLLRYHEIFEFDPVLKRKDVLFFSEQLPLSLHFFMFLRQLKNLCSDEQVKTILQPAMRGQILGCYAQTELGHGSDVQNLMTTATFDEATDSFIINTPSVEATKWWIGDLGIFANHALISAQLIIKGKKFGIHSFVVPIRDSKHNVLPNVELGDVGPKFGYNTKDNGYARFNNHKISRMNMLMRYTKVSPTGQYTRQGDEKITYATMLMIRSIIPEICYHSYSKAVLIVTRYSLIRSQFKDSKGKQIPILDYQLQQEKVIPKIAQAFAVMFSANRLIQIGMEVINDAKNGIFTRLKETHAISSGLKSILTTDTMSGLEVLRRACGGHGFSQYSGLPVLLSETSPTVTYEGENTILLLQTARFILKSLGSLQKGKRLSPTVMYLEELQRSDSFVANFSNVEDIYNPENIRKIFLYQSCERARRVAEKISTLTSQGVDGKQVWDKLTGISLVEAATVHTYLWIFQNFYQQIYHRTENERVRAVLFKLLVLYGIEKIIERAQSFFETGVITSETYRNLHVAREKLISELRPQALNLVEAFGYDDNTVHSAIGCSDGKPYERLLDWSKNKNIVNREDVKKQIYDVMIESLKQSAKPKL